MRREGRMEKIVRFSTCIRNKFLIRMSKKSGIT